ncbi:hypothetical protein FOA52_000173 [Chlamydomonas sp. UWO 241]|nr:hypothetical protein FOA52_000173 [Chlamydomonas sp. UWO 241]
MRGKRQAAVSGSWSIDDNKSFECALAQHWHAADRWTKIAAKLPGKNACDVQHHFELLEADVMAIHSGGLSPSSSEPQAKKQKTGGAQALSEQDRRKGVSWSEEEHRMFLLGLAKFGKGSWRSIARQFVISRTPTQVASHAQKYFLRLNSVKDKKDKQRASIHDITTDHVVAHAHNPYAYTHMVAVPPAMPMMPYARMAAAK